MDHSHSTRRRVTTCGECYRRKQKCNRQKPCNFCLRRGVADRCRYDDPSSYANTAESLRSREISALTEPENQSPNLSNTSLLSVMGYSPSGSVNKRTKEISPGSAVSAVSQPETNQASWVENFPWGLYKRLVALLPNQVIIDELVATYFSEANWHAQILDPVFFNDSYREWLSVSSESLIGMYNPESSCIVFPGLLFQVLAVALLYLPRGTMSESTLGLQSERAKSDLSWRWSTIGARIAALSSENDPTTVIIEHDLVRALWLKSSSQGLAAWKLLGRAIRHAQQLGLHLDAEPTACNTGDEMLLQMWQHEYHRRLWITLFSWDSHMASLLERPRAINMSDCSLTPPLGCDIPVDRSTAFPVIPSLSSKPSLFANRLFTYRLALKSHEILSSGANSRTIGNFSAVTQFHYEIEAICAEHHPALRENNPDTSWDAKYPVVRCQREMAKLMANSVLLGLHRDHVQIHTFSRNAAFVSALACLDAQQLLMDILPSNQKRIYGLSCHAIDCCIFIANFAAIPNVHDSRDIDRIINAIQSSIERLEQLVEISPVARSGTELLRAASVSIGLQRPEDTTDYIWAPTDVEAASSLYCADKENSGPNGISELESLEDIDIEELSRLYAFEF